LFQSLFQQAVLRQRIIRHNRNILMGSRQDAQKIFSPV
jgi:hypothetical protein